MLVVHEMMGEPVTREHGGPVRLLVGPMYGYKSLKWLDRIEVADGLVPGYWEERGYDVDAWVGQSNGRSDDPTASCPRRAFTGQAERALHDRPRAPPRGPRPGRGAHRARHHVGPPALELRPAARGRRGRGSSSTSAR